jgi:hypothetical protein
MVIVRVSAALGWYSQLVNRALRVSRFRNLAWQLFPSLGFVAFIAAARLFAGSGFQGFCLFRAMLGIDCPGCGITSSVLALFRGHLLESWQLHHAGIAVVAYFGSIGVLPLMETIERVGPDRTARFRWWAERCLTVILLSLWLGKIAASYV